MDIDGDEREVIVVFEAGQHIQKCQGIRSAGTGNDQRIAPGKKPVCPDKGLDAPQDACRFRIHRLNQAAS